MFSALLTLSILLTPLQCLDESNFLGKYCPLTDNTEIEECPDFNNFFRTKPYKKSHIAVNEVVECHSNAQLLCYSSRDSGLFKFNWLRNTLSSLKMSINMPTFQLEATHVDCSDSTLTCEMKPTVLEKQGAEDDLLEKNALIDGLCVRGFTTRAAPRDFCYWIDRSSEYRDFELLNVTGYQGIAKAYLLSQLYDIGAGDACLVEGPDSTSRYVLTSRGILSNESKANCHVYRDSTVFKELQLSLSFEENKLELSASFLGPSCWKDVRTGIQCFANGTENVEIYLSSSTTTDNRTHILFELERAEEFKIYHCQGLSGPEETVVRSESICAVCPKSEPETLESLLASNETAEEVVNRVPEVSRGKNLSATDISLIARILEKSSNSFQTTSQDSSIFDGAAEILDLVMATDTRVLEESQKKYNSSNVLIANFEEMLNKKVPVADSPDGTAVVAHASSLTLVADPKVANVSGLALFRDPDSGKTNMKKLFANETVENLLTLKNLEVAAFVPQTLLDSAAPSRIKITVFLNSTLFKVASEQEITASVLSITMPDQPSELAYPVSIIYRASYCQRGGGCGFWNYTSRWGRSGMELGSQSEDFVVCKSSHLTHFSYIMMGEGEKQEHVRNLVILSKTCCGLSVVGFIGILTTALFLESWRQQPGSKVLLNLSFVNTLQLVLVTFVDTPELSRKLTCEVGREYCVALGASLQYSVLAGFTWTLITAYLQYKRYVKVLGNILPENFVFKCCCVAWGFPLAFVVWFASFFQHLYIPSKEHAICYPKKEALVFGVHLPIFAIISANILIYLAILLSIFWTTQLKSKISEQGVLKYQLKVSVVLLFLMGFPWIFGFCAAYSSEVTFSYLFTATATVQGFVLFFYFIILNEEVHKKWRSFSRKFGN